MPLQDANNVPRMLCAARRLHRWKAMIPTIDVLRSRSLAITAGALLSLTVAACSHPGMSPEPTLAAADSARALAAADSARVADSTRVLDSIAAHGEVVAEAPTRVMRFESIADSMDYVH